MALPLFPISPQDLEPPLYAQFGIERMYERMWSTVCFAAVIFPKNMFHTTTCQKESIAWSRTFRRIEKEKVAAG